MKKILFFLVLLSMGPNSYCWDIGAKIDAQRSSTSNVNLSDTLPIKDSYTTLKGYLQAKNEFFKIKLRARNEKYQFQNANDNYFADLGVQYKRSPDDDYTLGVFKQGYNGASIVSTDTTSDNTGARFSADFSRDYGNDNSAYLSIKGSQKKYSKISGRTDKIIGANLGIEHYFSTQFMVNADFTLQKNQSTYSYYRNLTYVPNLLISYSPHDYWEFFADGSYAQINYSGREVVVNGITQNVNETQSLVTFDIGTIYKITKNVSLQIDYTIGKNTSNNPISTYKTDILNFGVTLTF